MTRFQTLMRREWMQHHRAWLLFLLVPPVLMLAMLSFGHLMMDGFDALQMVVFATVLGTLLVTGIFAAATVLQLPGLARRDEQDRSIEFWLSLPISHTASVAATLLMHLLVMPLAAIGVGYLASQLAGLILVGRVQGIGPWLALPWGLLLPAGLAAGLRLAVGGVLAAFWLSPLLLLAMVASAWLKRWGAAVLVVVLVIGDGLLKAVYRLPVVGDTVSALTVHALESLVTPGSHAYPGNAGQLTAFLRGAPGHLASDALVAIGNLAQPLAVFAALFSAACFGLLVLRRRHHR